MNPILRNLALENYMNFANSFDNSKEMYWDQSKKRLRHSGEFGTHREELIRKWLTLVVPQRLSIGSGFIIGPRGAVSTQCDIIIYDKSRTPLLQNSENQRFFPVETVCGVGEVKSIISTPSQLNKYLRKLAEVKKIRDDIEYQTPYWRHPWGDLFDPNTNPYDSIFTFLICKKVDFKVKGFDYQDVSRKHFHNLIFSMTDGMWAYIPTEMSTTVLEIPFQGPYNHSPWFQRMEKPDLASGEKLSETVVDFIAMLSKGISLTTLLNIDMVDYISARVSDEDPKAVHNR